MTRTRRVPRLRPRSDGASGCRALQTIRRVICMLISFHCISFRNTTPPFMTNFTRSISVMSGSGSPDTATRSAYLALLTMPTCLPKSKFKLSAALAGRHLQRLRGRHAPLHVIGELKGLHAVADGVSSAAENFLDARRHQPLETHFREAETRGVAAAGLQIARFHIADQIPQRLHSPDAACRPPAAS